MKMRAVSVLFLIFLTLGFIRVTSFLSEEKLEGKWRLREMDGEFKFCPEPGKADWPTMTFSNGSFAYEYSYERDGQPRKKGVTGTFTCDNNQSPKQITFVFGGRMVVAIYKASFGTLQISVGEHDDIPPDKFRGGAFWYSTARPALLIFERVRD